MSKKNKFNNYYSSLESSEETKKYIKEMYAMSEKNAKNGNIIFVAFGIPLLIIFALTITQMFSFSINLVQAKSKSSQVEIVSNIPVTTKTESTGNTSTDNKETVSPTNSTSNDISTDKLNTKIEAYLKENENRKASLDKAIALNNGSEKGLATMFIAQILRDNGYDIPQTVINTKGLVSKLEEDGWEKVTDFNELEKGDICFTVKAPSGAPSHTYIFMGWVTEGKTDNGYIVDNQVSEYNDTYHERNISVSSPKKDKFDFFMRKK